MKTYYQFLGVDEDADEDEIRAAYRRCMLKIHPDLHPEDTDAQEVTQRLNAAFQTLLDHESREKYDESLQRQRELESQPSPDTTEIPTGDDRASAFRSRAHPSSAPGPKQPSRSKKAGKAGKPRKLNNKKRSYQRGLLASAFAKLLPISVGLGSAGIVVLLLLWIIKGQHPLDLLQPPKTALKPEDLVVDFGETDTPANTSEADNSIGQNAQVAQNALSQNALSQNLVADLTGQAAGDASETMPSDIERIAAVPDVFTEPQVTVSPQYAVPSQSAGPPTSHPPASGHPGSVDVAAAEPSSDDLNGLPMSTGELGSFESKEPFDFGDESDLVSIDQQLANQTTYPTPTETERAEKRKLVATLFKDRYSSAKSRPQKRQLAAEILSVAAETHDDIPGMYVLLRIGRDMAVNAGDVRLAEQAIDQLARYFEINRLRFTLDAFKQIEKNVVDRSGKEHLYAAATRLIDEFESQDDYDSAMASSRIAVDCARSLRNGRLVQASKDRQEQVERVGKKLKSIEPSIALLAADPSDPQANLAVGQYLCFWKGQWDRGLKMLANCSNPSLCQAATLDLATDTSEDALETGDQWWQASQELDPHESKQARARAVVHYLRARDKTNGLHRRRIEQRIAEVDISDIAYLAQRVFDGHENSGGTSPNLGHGHLNSIGMKLIRIPAGRFVMGSQSQAPISPLTAAGISSAAAFSDEHPPHSVTISSPFYMGMFEVTVAQFAEFVRDSGYVTEAHRDGRGGEGWNANAKAFVSSAEHNWTTPGFAQSSSHPVVLVSWNDAEAFCEWLSRREGKTYRLPYEAEWEYACRAGSQTRYQHGNIAHDLERFANVFDEGSSRFLAVQKESTDGDDAFLFTAPTGSFLPNRFGLFDMQGNVWEWCRDGYLPTYYASSPAVDPKGSPGGMNKSMRGGSFFSGSEGCRSAKRNFAGSTHRSAVLGFRIVMEAAGP